MLLRMLAELSLLQEYSYSYLEFKSNALFCHCNIQKKGRGSGNSKMLHGLIAIQMPCLRLYCLLYLQHGSGVEPLKMTFKIIVFPTTMLMSGGFPVY